MRVLAVETSTEYCSVALWQEGMVLDRCERVGQKHSEVLMAMLDDMLREAGVKLAGMTGIAFGAGPGSFTGVRIACGVAQGLALGADLPVLGVCTLQALAQASGRDKVVAALDARMAEVYHAAYERRDGAWFAVSEPSLCLPQDAPLVAGGGWFGAGSGFVAHGAQLRERYAANIVDIDEQVVPQAVAIAQLAAAQFAAGRGMDAAEALPLYLRDKVALKTSERGQ
ncbi:MAG: tRNA (adenosine(37)-N6)-threonylcarbamoyltransferase complex dimerization subunit type 1 TsaB [Sideroxydans sp.]|nr:tRNA (adenosine(37)-N6)-threonylcarbamoyltransferase complex dimerization subunit type 1 TsaB [Sideroxydans sp.]